jgi:hypothetical protein
VGEWGNGVRMMVQVRNRVVGVDFKSKEKQVGAVG